MRTAWSDVRLLRCLWSQPRRTSRGTATHVIASSMQHVGWVACLAGQAHYKQGTRENMRAQNSIRLPLSSYFIRFSVESNNAGEVESGACCILQRELFHTSRRVCRRVGQVVRGVRTSLHLTNCNFTLKFTCLMVII